MGRRIFAHCAVTAHWSGTFTLLLAHSTSAMPLGVRLVRAAAGRRTALWPVAAAAPRATRLTMEHASKNSSHVAVPGRCYACPTFIFQFNTVTDVEGTPQVVAAAKRGMSSRSYVVVSGLETQCALSDRKFQTLHRPSPRRLPIVADHGANRHWANYGSQCLVGAGRKLPPPSLASPPCHSSAFAGSNQSSRVRLCLSTALPPLPQLSAPGDSPEHALLTQEIPAVPLCRPHGFLCSSTSTHVLPHTSPTPPPHILHGKGI